VFAAVGQEITVTFPISQLTVPPEYLRLPHVDIVNTLGIAPADKEKILWRNAAAFFNLEVAG
jgi:hypothetical protein